MAVTKFTDLIVPKLFAPYDRLMSTERSMLVKSGIMSPDFDKEASGSGTTVSLPYANALRGKSQGLDKPLVANKLTAVEDVCAIHRRGDMFGSNGFARALAGDDPLSRVAEQLADYWNREYQGTILLPSLEGIFGGALASTHVLDLSIADGKNAGADQLISAEAFIDAAGLLGDAWEGIRAVCVHSVVARRLRKLNLVETVQLHEQAIKYQTFQGRLLMEDDGMPVADGATSGKVYTSYLFAEGAVGYGRGVYKDDIDKELEEARDAPADDDYFITRRQFIVHPRGVAYVGAVATTPTVAELKNPANWQKRWEDKLIRIVQLKTNG